MLSETVMSIGYANNMKKMVLGGKSAVFLKMLQPLVCVVTSQLSRSKDYYTITHL